MPLDQRIPEIKVEKCVEMDYAPSEPFKYRRSPRKRPYFMVEVPFVNLLPENPKASVMLDGHGDLPPLQLSEDEGEGEAASRLQCGPNDKAKIASGESSSSDDDSGSSSSSDEQPLILNCSICQVQCPGQVAFRRHMIQHFSPAVSTITKDPVSLSSSILDKNKPSADESSNKSKGVPPDSQNKPAEQTSPKELNPPPREAFLCDVCGCQFGQSTEYKLHIQVQHRNLKFCPVCLKSSRSISDLLFHMKETHGEVFTFFCDTCGKGFQRKGHMNRHKKKHSSPEFSCHICHKEFNRKDYFETHMKAHSKRKEYMCKVCGHSFKQRSHLNTHMKIHDDFKAFKCGLCRQEFTLRHHLESHRTKYQH